VLSYMPWGLSKKEEKNKKRKYITEGNSVTSATDERERRVTSKSYSAVGKHTNLIGK